MNKVTALLGLIGLVAAAQAEEQKTIYKYTDENGVIHYSETKPNEDYKEADLPPLSIIPSTPVNNRSNSSSSQQEGSEESIEQRAFEIIEPADQENIWGSGGKLTAKVDALTEEQKQQYQIQFIIDGKKQQPSDKNIQVFDDIFRGEHKIKAVLLNKYTQKVIKESKSITIYMHQNSKK
jgi:hypothetical protein